MARPPGRSGDRRPPRFGSRPELRRTYSGTAEELRRLRRAKSGRGEPWRPEPEDDGDDGAPVSSLTQLSRRLGPRGRFLAVAVAIGVAITGASLLYDRYTVRVAAGADPANPAQVAMGKGLYARHCVYCHGAALEGQPGWDGSYPTGGRPATPLDGEGRIVRLADRDLFDVTKFGGQVFSPAGYKNDMPAFELELGDAEIWAILSYVKSRWPADAIARQAAEQERRRAAGG